MINDTYIHDEKILQKIHKNQYRRRFGVQYSFKKGNSLDLKHTKIKKSKKL